MSLAKRGLGRGLEALLVDVPLATEHSQLSPLLEQGQSVVNPQLTASAELQHLQEIAETLQQEGRWLLKEAEALRDFLDDFSAIL